MVEGLTGASPPALVAVGLRFRYPGAGRELAFPDVSLPQGAHAVWRGPSGCGKSTWLALAAGLRSAQAGRFELVGREWSSMSASARDAWRGRMVGFLPQRLHLSEGLSALQNVCLPFWAQGAGESQHAIEASAMRALADLGVADVAHQRPAQLSGGQAQRVALARATVLSPRVILADEPTASLDDRACDAALSLLLARADALGASLVVATHDARAVARLAERGAMLWQLEGSSQ